jgi:hypothetical protein
MLNLLPQWAGNPLLLEATASQSHITCIAAGNCSAEVCSFEADDSLLC